MTMLTRYLSSHIVGQVVVTLCNLLFLPIYIKYLGSSGYAFYGLYVVFLSWLVLLDGGLTPTIVREFGKFSSSNIIPLKLRNVFKSIEIIFFFVSLIIILLFYFLGDQIIEAWLTVDDRYKDKASLILLLVVSLSSIGLFESLYRGALLGLQNHLKLNVVISLGALFRSLGSVVLLVHYELTIVEFFFWHILITFVYVLAMKYLIFIEFSKGRKEKSIFSFESLRSVSPFAGSMFIILLLGTALTQLDKIILGKILNMSELGYYLFAFTCVGIIPKLASPIISTFYPKFCELFNLDKKQELIDSLNDSSQLVLLFTVGLTSVLITNSYGLILVWSGDQELSLAVSKILSILAIGSFLNAMTWMPYYAQIANGVTRVTILGYSISTIILIPLIFFLAQYYGSVGAAIAWPLVNIFLFLFCVNLGLKEVFPEERKKWFINNFFKPILPITMFILLKINFLTESLLSNFLILDILFTFIIVSIIALYFLDRTWKFSPFLRKTKEIKNEKI